MVVGIFNEIMFSFEKRGRLRNKRNMAHFKEVLEECDLSDLGFFMTMIHMGNGSFVEK